MVGERKTGRKRPFVDITNAHGNSTMEGNKKLRAKVISFQPMAGSAMQTRRDQ